MSNDDLTYIDAACHCELNTFSVAFKTSSLPISTDLCHCTTCRHVSGQLAVEHISFIGVPLTSTRPGTRSRARHGDRARSRSPGGGARARSRSGSPSGKRGPAVRYAISKSAPLLAPPSIVVNDDGDPLKPFDLGDLTAYKSSPEVTRYFCRSCSAHLFWVRHNTTITTPEGGEKKGDKWAVAIGALDETEGIVEVGYHIWVGDTLDGGIADHIRVINGVELPRYKEDVGSELVPITPRKVQPVDNASSQLKAFCHCRAISFSLTRPNEESFMPSSAYPDVMYPAGVTRLSRLHNPTDEKWWLAPRGTRSSTSSSTSSSTTTPSSEADDPPKTKFLAGHCMCTFCRLTSGFEVQSWAFVPLANIVDPNTSQPLDLSGKDVGSTRPKGLKQYLSSPGKYREFCATCGATAFWWRAELPGLVDVSVGLLDAESGARAEEWLEWHKDRVSYEEMALSPKLAQGLSEGLKL